MRINMNLDDVYKEVQEVRQMIEILETNQHADHLLLVDHDKILVRGNGVPSLQETVRVLAKTMTDFISEAQSEKKVRREEARHWKWLLIGIGVPAVVSFLGQAIVFWVRVVPIMDTIK